MKRYNNLEALNENNYETLMRERFQRFWKHFKLRHFNLSFDELECRVNEGVKFSDRKEIFKTDHASTFMGDEKKLKKLLFSVLMAPENKEKILEWYSNHEYDAHIKFDLNEYVFGYVYDGTDFHYGDFGILVVERYLTDSFHIKTAYVSCNKIYRKEYKLL